MDLRPLALAALVAVALLPGCLEDDAAPSDPGPAPVADASVTRTGATELGSVKGTAIAPSRYDFKVLVPAGGASNVHWAITIDGPLANNVNNHVEGPGCSGGGNVALSVAVMGASTTGGSCGDLSEGEHDFTAVIGSTALGFTATVYGDATLVYDVEPA